MNSHVRLWVLNQKKKSASKYQIAQCIWNVISSREQREQLTIKNKNKNYIDYVTCLNYLLFSKNRKSITVCMNVFPLNNNHPVCIFVFRFIGDFHSDGPSGWSTCRNAIECIFSTNENTHFGISAWLGVCFFSTTRSLAVVLLSGVLYRTHSPFEIALRRRLVTSIYYVDRAKCPNLSTPLMSNSKRRKNKQIVIFFFFFYARRAESVYLRKKKS